MHSGKPVSVLGTGALTGLLVPTVTGVAVGVLSKLADHLGPELQSLASNAGLWVFIVAVLGRTARSMRAAVLHAVVFLLVATVVYYVTYWMVDGSVAPMPIIAIWLVGSVTAGPILGALGQLTGRRTRSGALSTAALAGFLASEAALLGLVHTGVHHWLVVLFDACTGAGILLTSPAARHLRLWTFVPTLVFVLGGLALPWVFQHFVVGLIAP
jgi:hypothetical protein